MAYKMKQKKLKEKKQIHNPYFVDDKFKKKEFIKRQDYAIKYWQEKLKEAKTKENKIIIKYNIRKFKQFRNWGINQYPYGMG
jgi:hypothetical protein